MPLQESSGSKGPASKTGAFLSVGRRGPRLNLHIGIGKHHSHGRPKHLLPSFMEISAHRIYMIVININNHMHELQGFIMPLASGYNGFTFMDSLYQCDEVRVFWQIERSVNANSNKSNRDLMSFV